MLTEIALTPQTFQACSIQPNDWARELRALNQRLLHYGSQCPLIFSNLNRGSPHRTPEWHTEVRRLVGGAGRQHRQLLADLLKLIEQYLVARPSLSHVRVPADEVHWVREAIGPAPAFPIDQVVVTFSGRSAALRVYARSRNINQLDGDPFWNGITLSAFPPMTVQGQIGLLRPIWLHGQVLAVVLPYAIEQDNRGRPHGEAHWFFEFAAAAFGRPAGYRAPAIELHVSYDGNGADMIARGAAHPLVAAFIAAARAHAGLRGQEFALYVRTRSNGSQRFIARRLFAGEETIEDPSSPDVRVRWGIALEHVAQPNDAQNQTPPTFTLLPRVQADSQFRFECRNASPRLAGPIRVQC